MSPSKRLAKHEILQVTFSTRSRATTLETRNFLKKIYVYLLSLSEVKNIVLSLTELLVKRETIIHVTVSTMLYIVMLKKMLFKGERLLVDIS